MNDRTRDRYEREKNEKRKIMILKCELINSCPAVYQAVFHHYFEKLTVDTRILKSILTKLKIEEPDGMEERVRQFIDKEDLNIGHVGNIIDPFYRMDRR